METKDELVKSLKLIIKSLTGEEIEAQVVASSDLSKGDFSTNVAMVAFGRIRNQESGIKNPMELAEKIIEILNSEFIIHDSFRLIEAKPPGFINFWLSNEEIEKSLSNTLKGFDSVSNSPKSSLILEFGDPNPFKEPHIGHLRNLIIGESLARLLESQGMKVIRANYQGDVGPQVAKAIWGILLNQKSKIKSQKLDEGTLEENAKVLAEAYVDGAKAYEEDPEVKKEIDEINIKIYSAVAKASTDVETLADRLVDKQNDIEIYSLWQKGRSISLQHFETLYKSLGVKYDKYYFESETAPIGKEIVEKNTPKVFEKDGGALIFRGEKFGLHTRVFVTSQGNAMYEAKDLALAVLKDKDFPDVKSLIMTANEQVEYFKVMIAALSEIDKKIADKTTHLSYGFVNLKDGKMSSRTGNVVSAFWLLEETKKRLKEGYKDVEEEVLGDIAAGAVKWTMLKFSRESDILFSIDESIQIEGNSGPYMQYTYARTSSLLSKSSKTSFARLAARQEANSVKNLEPELVALGRLICQFENVKKESSGKFSPNILTNYLYNLAQKFNGFYEKEKIIGSKKEESRLAVTKAVGNVLKEGLNLLGIATPEKI